MLSIRSSRSRPGAPAEIATPTIAQEDEIARGRDLNLSGLRARWHSVFRRKAPDHLPRHLLYRIIAYRLQADRLGDLDRDTQLFLDRVAAGTRNGGELPEGSDH